MLGAVRERYLPIEYTVTVIPDRFVRRAMSRATMPARD
jgi:hypothetical protein